MKSIAVLVTACAIALLGAGFAKAQDEIVTVGGDLKFYLYDQSRGDYLYMAQDADTMEEYVVQGNGHNNMSAGLSALYLYLSKDITDTLSVNVDPEIRVSAGATPRLGGGITRVTEEEIHIEFLRANLTWILPNDFQLKAGYLKPLFTWDYGYELFWHEEIHASYVTANSWLSSWHDSGIELYKTFEPQGFSLPAYLYLLNGPDGGLVDNNNGRSALIHVAPELMQGMVKLLGSYGFGKWDDAGKHDMQRYAFGININVGDLMLRSEYMGGKWEDKFLVKEKMLRDVSPSGYYVKALYQVIPDLKVLANYSHLAHDFSGFFFTASGVGEVYDTYTLGLDYELADGITAILQYNMVDAGRDDGTAALDYNRLTLGIRATF